MKAFFSNLVPSFRATLVLVTITCGIYPLFITVISQLVFPEQARGSLITSDDGTLLGSRLLGQSFISENYFHPRPSAAGTGYDASSSGGSNLGPTSQKLHDAVKERISAYRGLNGLAADSPVPADAVTASASGLDPHISVKNAVFQAARVARKRGLPLDEIQRLIVMHTETSIFGPDAVNVLALNLALDGT